MRINFADTDTDAPAPAEVAWGDEVAGGPPQNKRGLE